MNLLNSLKVVVFIVIIVFFSCKKSAKISVIPSSVVEPSDSKIAAVETVVKTKLDSVFLDDINFLPSDVKIVLNANALGYLNGFTYNRIQLSSSGWTHPSVLYFKDGFNGYNYWMALTPYPNSDNQYENPYIFCSNDGVNWIEPIGITNPIEKAPLKPMYNSDVNLVYDNGKLYCYWRQNGNLVNNISSRTIFERHSDDGVKWSESSYVASWPINTADGISPSIIHDGDNYYCYAVSSFEKTKGSYYDNYSIRRATSSTNVFARTTNPDYEIINITNGRPWGLDQEPWHLEVRKVGDIWFMLVATTNNNLYGDKSRLFLGQSKDGINFQFGEKPICSSVYTYKSSFIITPKPENSQIEVKLWRTSSLNNWTLYYDKFFVKAKFVQ